MNNRYYWVLKKSNVRESDNVSLKPVANDSFNEELMEFRAEKIFLYESDNVSNKPLETKNFNEQPTKILLKW